jgi:hypothetical protein
MNGIPTRLRIPQQGRFEGMNPTFPGFGAVVGPRIAPWTVMGNGKSRTACAARVEPIS